MIKRNELITTIMRVFFYTLNCFIFTIKSYGISTFSFEDKIFEPSCKESVPKNLKLDPFEVEEIVPDQKNENLFISDFGEFSPAGPMLILREDMPPKLNTEVMNNDLFQDLLQLVEYMYQGTKRYAFDKRYYPDAFSPFGKQKPKLYKTLTEKGIVIADAFFGTHGGIEASEIGMLAYRLEKDKKLLQLFIVLEGSQGEDFEFLGGFGGASWRTNFQSRKKEIDPLLLNISKKYLPAKEQKQKLSFHEGFLNKILTSKIYFENALKNLFYNLKIADYNALNCRQDIESIYRKNQKIHFSALVDHGRGFTVQAYIVGHSQGGGLVQVAAPYYTTLIGEYLYGPLFDNKEVNLSHAIALSPARAIGDCYTRDVVENVMGKGNIFGYCSPADVVTVVPFGKNIGKDKIKQYASKALLTCLKALSHFLPKEYGDLVETICSTDTHYEDLSTWAYEDPVKILLVKYAALSKDAAIADCNQKEENYEKVKAQYPKKRGIFQKIKGVFIKEKDLVKESKRAYEDSKKKVATIENLLKLDTISKTEVELKEAQKNYFKMHVGNTLKQNKFAVKAAKNFHKIFKKYCPIGDWIAAQHFGTMTQLIYEDETGKHSKFDSLFDHRILNGDLLTALKAGFEYHQRKKEFTKN